MPTTVALFVGCLTDQFHPRVGVATVKVLEHFGCRVTFPMGQTCCGQPLLHAGLADEAAAVARHFVTTFEAAEYVVTPSPACASTVRDRYPKLLADDAAYEAGMWHIAGRTYDLVEFLTTVLKADVASAIAARSDPLARGSAGGGVPRRPVGQRGVVATADANPGQSPGLMDSVTYHPACPLRTLAVPDDTPRLLRQMGLAVVPLPAADVCCGFGGPFAERYPSLSHHLADAKLRAIASTAAAVTVCNEAGCAIAIGAAAARAGTPRRLSHVAELLADALGLDADRW